VSSTGAVAVVVVRVMARVAAAAECGCWVGKSERLWLLWKARSALAGEEGAAVVGRLCRICRICRRWLAQRSDSAL
jgi:hypothetical protein